MKNGRLSLIFNTFSKKETRDLRKWLNSPAHNQRQDVRDLFEYLVKNTQNGSEKSLNKENVFKKIFTNQIYDDAKFRQTIHFLHKAIEEFLIFQQLTSDQVKSKTALATVFRKRKIDKLFNKSIKEAKDLQQKSEFRNADFQQNEFQIELEEYSFREKQKRTTEMNLQELTNALDLTFIARKLRYSYLMYAHQNVYKTEYNFGFLNKMLSYIEEAELDKLPSIGVYYYGLKTHIEKGNPLHFQNLKKAIFDNTHLFPRSEARDIYLMAINHLIKQMNSGSDFAIREVFDLYKKGIEEKLLFEGEFISRFTFRNVIAIGLKLEEFEWVDSFIEGYEPFLQEKYRDNIVHFSKAMVAYTKKDYTTAMRLFTQVEYNDTLMNLNAKNILIKMFYEEDEFDSLESLLSSMRAYLTRKKVMGYHKSVITNFIKLTKKLLKVSPYDKSQIEKLRLDIMEAAPMASSERQWLLTQLGKV